MASSVRAGLDRDTIVRAALRLLDEVGLDGLTLRRLAQELGVQAPALYWHVKNKQALLDEMAAAIMIESDQPQEPRPGADWADWFAEMTRQSRRRLLAHRDGARLVAGARPLATLFPILERYLAALNRAGFTVVDALRNLTAANFFVAGFVQEEQAEKARTDAITGDEFDVESMRRLITDRHLPHVLVAMAEGGDPNGEEAFEHGLNLIIDGMRGILARQGGPAPLVDPGEAAEAAESVLRRWADVAGRADRPAEHICQDGES